MLTMPMLPLPLSGARRLNFTVREISGGHDRRRFVRLAANVYRGDRYWASGILSERLRSLDAKKNPGLAHTQLALFAAESRTMDEIIGSIAVWAGDPAGATRSASRVGCFGMFEVINEEEVAGSLFEAAESWAQEHLTEAGGRRGPMELDPFRSPGLLVDGYNHRPGVLMPYNLPYYPELIETAGYEPGTKLLAYQLDLSALRNGYGTGATGLQIDAETVQTDHALVLRDLQGEADWRGILPEAEQGSSRITWLIGPESPALTTSELTLHLKRIAARHPSATILAARIGEDGDTVAFGVAVPNVRQPALVTLVRRLTDGWLRGSGSASSMANVTLSGLVNQLPRRRASSEESPCRTGRDSSLSWLCRGACGTEPLRMTPRGDSAPREVRTRQGMAPRAARKAGIRLMSPIVRRDCLAWGLEAPILSELLSRAAGQGYTTAELSPAVDLAARDRLAALGASPCKTYAIYKKRF
jgi:hypothetical protein